MTTKGQTALTPAKGSTNKPNWHDKTHAPGCWYVEEEQREVVERKSAAAHDPRGEPSQRVGRCGFCGGRR